MIVIKNPRLRRVLRIVIPFVVVPIIVVTGAYLFEPKRQAFTALAVAISACVLFLAGFEHKKTGSRRLIIVSVFIALSVIGRFIPFFKPVTALTIIAGVYLGGEAGFLCGAFSALISNFYFGQGPWTPFQMLAWGMIGFFAGVFSKFFKKSRFALIIYGAITGFIFSVIMDIWTVLWYSGTFSKELFFTAILTALPHTALYSVSNVIFLFLIARPMGEKLTRIKMKYGV